MNNKINRKSFFGKLLFGIGALFGIKSVAENSLTEDEYFTGVQGVTGTGGSSGQLAHGTTLNRSPYNFSVNEIRDENGKIIQIDLIQENGLIFKVTGKDIDVLLDSNNSEFIKTNITNWTSNTNSAPDFKSFDFAKELFFVK